MFLLIYVYVYNNNNQIKKLSLGEDGMGGPGGWGKELGRDVILL